MWPDDFGYIALSKHAHAHTEFAALMLPMTAEDFERYRKAYSYPAVGLLEGYVHVDFPSVSAMEVHHQRMLLSHKPEESVAGYLSVIYWGNYSSQDGRINAPFARARVRRVQTGLATKGHTAGHVQSVIGTSHRLIVAHQYGHAIWGLHKSLYGVGLSFASKILAFLAPEHCGVADSQIAERFPKFDFMFDRNGVKSRLHNAHSYDDYCHYLINRAAELNREDDNALSSGSSRTRWRAVDVERALFASPTTR